MLFGPASAFLRLSLRSSVTTLPQHRCSALIINTGDTNVAMFSSRRGGRGGGRRGKTGSGSGLAKSGPPPPTPASADPWQEVKDPVSGEIYWWNTITDETTAIGDPKPTSMTATQNGQGGIGPLAQPQGSGFMSVVKQGFGFGIGSAVAHTAIGGLFGGGGGGGESGGDDVGGGHGGSGGDDSWDI